jgi:hypothetical protein
MPVIPPKVVRNLPDDEFLNCIPHRRDSHSTLIPDLFRRMAMGNRRLAFVNGAVDEPSPMPVGGWREINSLFKEGQKGQPHHIADIILASPATLKDPLPIGRGGMRMSPIRMRGFLRGVRDKRVTWEQLTPGEEHTLTMAKDVYNRERDAALKRK